MMPGVAPWMGLYFDTMQGRLSILGGWPRTVLTGAAVAVSAALFNPLSVATVATVLYMIFGVELTDAQAEAMAPFASYLATWGFFFLLTVLLSKRAARLAGSRFYQHVLFVGLSAAVVTNLFIAARFPPWVWFEVLAYLALGLLGGLIGACRGQRERRPGGRLSTAPPAPSARRATPARSPRRSASISALSELGQ